MINPDQHGLGKGVLARFPFDVSADPEAEATVSKAPAAGNDTGAARDAAAGPTKYGLVRFFLKQPHPMKFSGRVMCRLGHGGRDMWRAVA